VIFVIDHGRLVERGTHDQLLRIGGLYATLYEHQFAPQGAPQRAPQRRSVGPVAGVGDDDSKGVVAAGA
jgi:hypothetical protein